MFIRCDDTGLVSPGEYINDAICVAYNWNFSETRKTRIVDVNVEMINILRLKICLIYTI